MFFSSFSNLGLTNVPIKDEYPEKYDRLLCGGIWCIVQLDYEYVEEEKQNGYPIQIRKLTPIQMPHIDITELKQGRKAFSKTNGLTFYFVLLEWNQIRFPTVKMATFNPHDSAGGK